jgi:hypothetical protein
MPRIIELLFGHGDTIDMPHVREKLREHLGIAIKGTIPDAFYTERFILVGNYIGRGSPDDPDLRPTIDAITLVACELSKRSEKNRLLAVARETALDRLPADRATMLRPAMLKATKNGDTYSLEGRQTRTLIQHIQHGGGVWIAPTATVRKDGMLLHAHGNAVRLAREYNCHLGVLVMETVGEGEERRVNAITIEEVMMPVISIAAGADAILHQRIANNAITKFCLARVAQLLPGGQEQGEYAYPGPEFYMEEAMCTLRGLNPPAAREGIMDTTLYSRTDQ